MPRLGLQVDREDDLVWVTLDGQRLIPLRDGDREGLKVMMTWLVTGQIVSVEEAAAMEGVTSRTVEGHQATYARTGNSADLMDGRHFNPGQRTDYRMEAHKPALIRQATLNLMRGDGNSERGLAAQLGYVVDDRTVGRHLNAMGWRVAEETGLAEEVAAYLDAERRRAYWAGVAGEPLERVLSSSPREWQTPQPGLVGAALGVAHLALNGVYESLKRLVVAPLPVLSQWPLLRVWHVLSVYWLVSGGARLSQVKYFAWRRVQGLLSGCAGLSATSLRHWLVAAARQAGEEVTVRRSDGQEESITRLQDYQEEAVAQRLRKGLIQGRAIYLDDYVNAVFRREPIARAKHGTRYGICKAFRRHMAQDVDTGHAVTCPLGPSDVTPLAVIQRVVKLVNGGLERVYPGWQLELVIADRWWSVKAVVRWALQAGPKLLTWGRKDIKTIREALERVSEAELKQHPITAEVRDEATGQRLEQVVGYRLDTQLSIYDLEQPVRCVVEWDGNPGSKKLARLVIGVRQDEMGEEAVVDGLRFRQRVEILLKQLQHRLNLSAFGGGDARLRCGELEMPDEKGRRRLLRNRRQVATRQANDQARLREVERELEQLRQGESSTNGLKLGIRDLKRLAQNLKCRIQEATARLEELDGLLNWAEGNGPHPEEKPVAELDLTRESILTQLKLEVFTAQETLLDDFIEQALKPVLWEEAEQQAAQRRRQDKRSTAKGRQGEPLSTDVEELFQIKLDNLERETILKRLLTLQGEFVRHKTKRIILVVAHRFEDRRMQAAYERYCLILNQQDVRVPMDNGEPWRLLFTYHLDAPSSSAQFK